MENENMAADVVTGLIEAECTSTDWTNRHRFQSPIPGEVAADVWLGSMERLREQLASEGADDSDKSVRDLLAGRELTVIAVYGARGADGASGAPDHTVVHADRTLADKSLRRVVMGGDGVPGLSTEFPETAGLLDRDGDFVFSFKYDDGYFAVLERKTFVFGGV